MHTYIQTYVRLYILAYICPPLGEVKGLFLLTKWAQHGGGIIGLFVCALNFLVSFAKVPYFEIGRFSEETKRFRAQGMGGCTRKCNCGDRYIEGICKTVWHDSFACVCRVTHSLPVLNISIVSFPKEPLFLQISFFPQCNRALSPWISFSVAPAAYL